VRVRTLAALVSFLAAATVLAQGSKPAQSKPVIWPAADMKWVDMQPGPPGVKIVDLWGDHTKGAYGALIKFPAGFAAPLHTHANDMKIVVVSGTFLHGAPGETDVRLGPGSYFLQPGGTYKHTTGCDKASDCIIFAESKGAFTLTMAAEAAAPKK
jgi:anti-sigma factor ChrR (cupin superfamily)